MKIVSIIFILIVLVTGVWFGKEYLSNTSQAVNTTVRRTQVPEQNTNKEEVDTASLPQTLIIPKLGINAFVESVGLDSEGKMDIPKNVENVAWYILGYKPGEKGAAVIAGHYDKKDGSPAVFYELSSLKPGDEIIVLGENGKRLTYTVTRKQSYLTEQFPLQEVFGTQDKPRLNLITCAGTWNKGEASYTNRLVVYSELKR